MKFKVVIDVENAAFEDENLGPELGRILRGLADKLESGPEHLQSGGKLRDSNGNQVGGWFCKTEE